MIFLARNGATKSEIAKFAINSGYSLEINPNGFDEVDTFLSAEFTVQAAILHLLLANSFEETIRLGTLDNGDTDTQAAIAGSMAEALYGEIPTELVVGIWDKIPAHMKKNHH